MTSILSSLVPKLLSDFFAAVGDFSPWLQDIICEYHLSPSLPLVQFGVNDVLGLVGTGASGECDEVRQVVWRHALEQLVCRGEGFTCASGTHAQHLGRREGREGRKRKRKGETCHLHMYPMQQQQKTYTGDTVCSLVPRKRETFLSFHAAWVLDYGMYP